MYGPYRVFIILNMSMLVASLFLSFKTVDSHFLFEKNNKLNFNY